jgi:hypothetical protein
MNLEPSPLQLRGYSSVNKFLEVLGQLDDETQRQVISLVSAIDTSGQKSGMSKSTLQEILEASVVEVDGSYVQQPAAGLVEKVSHSPIEFIDAFYKAAEGRYSESIMSNGEGKVTRQIKVDLDEDRTRALSSIFGDKVMPFVEAFREAMNINPGQSNDEQIIAFMKKYHSIEKAHSIRLGYLGKTCLPDLGLTDWMRVIEIVESIEAETRANEVRHENKDFLAKSNLSLTDIIDSRKLRPGGDTEAVVMQLYNGALERSRKQ